jgi:hypothetical protein
MIFTGLLILFLLIPALIWLGIDYAGRRRRNQPNRPGSTDGGPPTVYRRHPLAETPEDHPA